MLGESIYGCKLSWVLAAFVVSTSLAFPALPVLNGAYSSFTEFTYLLATYFSSLLQAYATMDLDALAFTIGTTVLLETTFWSVNLLLSICYVFDLFPGYRLHGSHFPRPEQIKECIKDVAIGHFLVRPPLLYFSHRIFIFTGMETAADLIPDLKTIYLQLFLCIMADDTLFYWSHRMLHHPSLYKHIHKQHHSFKYTIGIATEYCHPIEDFFSNILSTASGPLLMGTHLSVTWMYLNLKLWQSIDAHSGYNWPFPVSPFSVIASMDCAPAHDYHHSHNVGNFGGYFIFWDYMMGTDKAYTKHLKAEEKKA